MGLNHGWYHISNVCETIAIVEYTGDGELPDILNQKAVDAGFKAFGPWPNFSRARQGALIHHKNNRNTIQDTLKKVLLWKKGDFGYG